MLGVLCTVVGLLGVVQVLPRSVALFWPLGFFTGVAGLVLSLRELSAIARGQSPAWGRRTAVMARTVSVVHAGLIALFFVGLSVVGFIQGFSRR